MRNISSSFSFTYTKTGAIPNFQAIAAGRGLQEIPLGAPVRGTSKDLLNATALDHIVAARAGGMGGKNFLFRQGLSCRSAD